MGQTFVCSLIGAWRDSYVKTHTTRFDRRSASDAKERTYCVAREETAVVSSAALRNSSPWPWVIALAISTTMWVSIGWLIWTLV
jgi:hypothetical protein